MTRCKVGDLVVIVYTHPDHDDLLGRFGTILFAEERFGIQYWVLDIKKYGLSVAGEDSSLRPIRDNRGDDETLLWAPVPSIHKETA